MFYDMAAFSWKAINLVAISGIEVSKGNLGIPNADVWYQLDPTNVIVNETVDKWAPVHIYRPGRKDERIRLTRSIRKGLTVLDQKLIKAAIG